MPVPKLSAQTTWSLLKPASFWGAWNLLKCQAEMPAWPAPVKAQGVSLHGTSLHTLHVKTTLHMRGHSSLLEELSAPCGSPLGEDLCLVSPRLCPYAIVDFAFYSFSVINFSPKCDYIWSLVRPASKSLKLGVVSGTLTQGDSNGIL